jgi:hypothetical protein
MSDAETTKKTRSEGYIDQQNLLINRDGVSYTLAGLPENVVTYLALVGLDHKVRTGGRNTYEKLKAGATQRPSASNELDPWRLAIAHSIVEQTKKTATPVMLDAAKVQAEAVTRENLVEAKKRPLVVKHWRKLTNLPEAGVLDLLSAPPAAADVAEEEAA